MSKMTVKDLDVKGKRVLVRVDFNVPIKDGVITDDNRMVSALPTINYLLENGAKVILFSHLGKVKTEEDKVKNDMAPVAKHLDEIVDAKVTFVAETRGAALEAAISEMNEGEVVLVQNTRFEAGETKNDPELSKYWASLGDLFVLDAFGTAHRAHASTVGVSELLPNALGFLVEKEVLALGNAINNPKRPLVAILGGSKVSSKIAVIENLLTIADKVLIGGGMTYTFFKAMGLEVGTSLVEDDKVEMAKEFMARAEGKLILPVDNIVANDFANATEVKTTDDAGIPAGFMGLDIGPKTVELFTKELQGAQTVVWNGPMGVFENPAYAQGTIDICKAISELPGALTVIGGGDSAAAAKNLGFADKFSHISTGGGASLEFMEGKALPGIEAIREK